MVSSFQNLFCAAYDECLQVCLPHVGRCAERIFAKRFIVFCDLKRSGLLTFFYRRTEIFRRSDAVADGRGLSFSDEKNDLFVCLNVHGTQYALFDAGRADNLIAVRNFYGFVIGESVIQQAGTFGKAQL